MIAMALVQIRTMFVWGMLWKKVIGKNVLSKTNEVFSTEKHPILRHRGPDKYWAFSTHTSDSLKVK